MEHGTATKDRAIPVCWYGKTSKMCLSKKIADSMLFSDGICVYLLRMHMHTYRPTRLHESLPKRFMHTQLKRRLLIRALHIWLPPFRSFPRASSQFFNHISVGHPWPPYLKSQSLQHSLSPLLLYFPPKHLLLAATFHGLLICVCYFCLTP